MKLKSAFHFHIYNNAIYIDLFKQDVYHCRCGKAKFSSIQAQAMAAELLVGKVKEAFKDGKLEELLKVALAEENQDLPCPHARASYKHCPHCMGLNQ